MPRLSGVYTSRKVLRSRSKSVAVQSSSPDFFESLEFAFAEIANGEALAVLLHKTIYFMRHATASVTIFSIYAHRVHIRAHNNRCTTMTTSRRAAKAAATRDWEQKKRISTRRSIYNGCFYL